MEANADLVLTVADWVGVVGTREPVVAVGRVVVGAALLDKVA